MTDWLVADRLAPSIGGSLEPLYAAAADGALALPFCPSCGIALELEQVVCDACGATSGPVWRTVDPVGHVHSATLVHRIEPGLVLTDQPYPVVDVEVTSGHRVVLTTASPAPVPPIGNAVRITFRRVGDVSVPSLEVLS
jgi:uncharacterized OB-fold protein